MKKVSAIFILFSLLFINTSLYSKNKSYVKKEKILPIKKVIVLPYCPANSLRKNKKLAKKAEYLGKIAGSLLITQLRIDKERWEFGKKLKKKYPKKHYPFKIYKYKSTIKKLKKINQKWECVPIGRVHRIARKLKVDAIFTGKILEIKKTEDYIKVKLETFLIDKDNRVLMRKISTGKVERNFFGTLQNEFYTTITDFNVKEKYKKYVAPISKAISKSVRFLAKKMDWLR